MHNFSRASRYLSAIAILFLFFIVKTQGQNCTLNYVDKQFGVLQERDVFYGTDTLFNGGIDSLRMNIFKPIGDNQTQRPILVAVHGGAWISGHRNDLDSLCYWYAQRGYVAATISYRLGIYGPWPFEPPFAYDQAEVIRASFRASQDLNGAIRYLKGRAAQDSSDMDQVYLAGFSAGAITAMHSAYRTDESERPGACGAIAPVSQLFVQYPRPDLGPVAGKLHNNGLNAQVKGVAAFFGAILDTAFIASPDDPALYLYHQTGDPVVGCGHQQLLWGLPLGVGANYPWMHGSCSIDPHIQHLGFDSTHYQFYLHQGPNHDVHDIYLMDNLVAVFFSKLLCPPTGTASEELSGHHKVFTIKTYPNPASTLVHITFEPEAGISRLKLLDLAGKTLLQRLVGPAETDVTLPLTNISAGFYILQAESQGKVYTQKLVLRNPY